MNQFDPSQHDLGYLLTAYADGQLAPEGVQWVEQQLTERPELKTRLDEIRAVQQTLRSGLAGLEFPLALDDVRRASVLAQAGRGPVATRKIRFHWPMIVGLAAACLTVAVVVTESDPHGSAARLAFEPSTRIWNGNQAHDVGVDGALADGGFAYATPASGPTTIAVPPQGAVDDFRRIVEVDKKLSDTAVAEDREVANQGREEAVATSEMGATGAFMSMKRGDASARRTVDHATANAQAATDPAAPEIVAGLSGKLSNQDALRKDWRAEKSDRGGIAHGAMNAPDLDIPEPSAGYRGRVAAAKSATAPAPVTTPAPDGYTRLNETLSYKGKLDARMPASGSNKKQSPAEQPAAPTTPAAPPTATTASRPVAKPAQLPKPQAAEPQLAQREKSEAQLERLQEEQQELHKSLTPQDKLLIQDEKNGKDQAFTDVRDGRQQLRQLQQAQAVDQEADGIVQAGGRDKAEQAKEKSAAGEDIPRAEAQQQQQSQQQQRMEDSTDQLQRFAEAKKSGHFYLRQLEGVNARTSATLKTQRGPHDAATNRALLSESLSMSGLGNALSLLDTVAGDADVVVGQNGLALLGVDNVRLHVQNLNRGQIVMQVARGVGLQVTPVDGQLELDRPRGQLDPTSSFGYDRETFRALFGSAPMLATTDDARSTFALDAETASYDRARAQIAAGQPIDPTTIRPEQFINAMPMDYPPASGAEAFTLYAEAAPGPFSLPSLRQNGDEPIAAPAWAARTALVAIGVVARPAGADERRPLHLTLAIDCSGSMGREGGLSRVQTGLAELVSHLRADDTVAVVAFSDQARLVLPATTGSERARITAAIAGLKADGATNAVDGLGLAYQVAAESVAPGAESRVVLASDGATLAGPGDLVETVLSRVRAHRERGVSLLVVGSGAGSYQAAALERLANRADGQQVFLGSDDEAKRIFSGRLLPERLGVLAKDAKVQVTWNPQRVSHARLIGYEQRRLAHADFRNDAVDAGELSHDAQVTALYEVLLIDGATGPLGSAAVRYHDTRLQQVRELSCPLPGTVLKSQSSDRLRLLACAAETAEWLQKGWWSNVRLPAPERIIAELGRCPQPAARELENLVRRAQQQETGKRK